MNNFNSVNRGTLGSSISTGRSGILKNALMKPPHMKRNFAVYKQQNDTNNRLEDKLNPNMLPKISKKSKNKATVLFGYSTQNSQKFIPSSFVNSKNV